MPSLPFNLVFLFWNINVAQNQVASFYHLLGLEVCFLSNLCASDLEEGTWNEQVVLGVFALVLPSVSLPAQALLSLISNSFI